MNYSAEKGHDPVSNQALLDENDALKKEIESLKARLEEAEELKRAIEESDFDALVIHRPEGELIFTLDSADKAYRVLVETMNEGTITLAYDCTILYCNRRFAELMKMPSQAIVGTSIYQFIAPENVSTFKTFLKQEIITGEINLIANGGEPLPAYISITSLRSEGSPNAWCIVATDLTEQKKNEEIIAAERLARSIIEQAAEAIIVCDTSGKITRFSNAASKICRCDPTFQIFEDIMDLRFSEGADAGKKILPISSALKGSAIFGTEASLKFKDCKKLHLLISSGPLKNTYGEIMGCVISLTDITEHKRVENRVRRYNRVLEGIHQISINVVQANTEEELGNACLSVALEITDGEIGFINLLDDDGLLHDIAISEGGWEQCLMYDQTGHRRPPGNFILHGLYGHVVTSGKSFFTNDPPSHSESIGLPYGHPPLTSFLGVPLVLEGKVMGMFGVANREGGYNVEQQEDLEAIAPAVIQAIQRKKAENERIRVKQALREANQNLENKVNERTAELGKAYKSLKESELGLAEAQKMAHLGSWYQNITTGEVKWSDEVYRIFGLKPQEFRMNSDIFLNYIHPEDRNYVINALKRALDGNNPYNFDYRIISASGEERIVHSQGEISFDKNIPIGIRGTIQDVTESKKAEKALQLVSKYNRSLIEASLDPLVTIGPDGRITDVNRATELVTGYSRDELIGTNFSYYFTEPEKAQTAYQEAFQEGFIRDYPLEIQYKDKRHVTPVLYNASVYKDESGKVIGIFAAARDITERRMVEEALIKIEKIRIKEIRHRIKNNLQVISSLLDLQAEMFSHLETCKTPEVIEAFQESQNRVVSMALIHEELYKGDKIDTRLYQNHFKFYNWVASF